MQAIRHYICFGVVSFLGAACLHAQSLPAVDYSKPRSQLPNFFAPYTPVVVAEPYFGNTPRIDELVKDGKLMLSLDDAIALTLENNLDLAIARYNLQIANADILRTRAGGSAQGVATGLLSGTPGGGVGGIGAGAVGAGAGGTTGGAGGAGTGASGLVQSTLGAGTSVPSFDPEITGQMSIEHFAAPLSNLSTTGVSNYRQNTATANFGYSQAFGTGTSLSVLLQSDRQTTNSIFTTLSPQINTYMRMTLTQHLLQGFGPGPNRRFIHIAQNNREISDVAFRNQVIATVTQIQNIYWDLVRATEDVKVKQSTLALAQKTLEDDRKQVQLESIAPIEVTRAEVEVENKNQDLTVAQSNLELEQLLINNAITRNITESNIADAEVIPTDTTIIPAQEPVVPIQDLIAQALLNRPELVEARIDLTNREISRRSVRNAMLPSLDAIAFYGGSGLAGVQNPIGPNSKLGHIPSTGLVNGLSSSFNNSAPDYEVGLRLNIPLRNRVAQADQVRSELEFRQAQFHMKQLQNQIGIEVRNAQFTLLQNRARLDAAKRARDLAQHSFDIEQKKFELGASSSSLVLQAGSDLAVAESNLVTATTDYEKSRVELDRATGTTLLHNGIEIADAESGYVHKMPNVPGVTTKPITAKPE